MSTEYVKEKNHERLIKLREILSFLPGFCTGFFLSLENTTAPLTRLNYAYDLRIFFDYLANNPSSPFLYEGSGVLDISVFGNIKNISSEHINNLNLADLRQYVSYIESYVLSCEQKDLMRSNGENGKKRKICSLRRFYKYLYNEEIISQNLASKIETPKIHEKPIVRLENDEILDIIKYISTGEGLSPAQLRYHAKTKLRDTAIVVLFLTTGIRVSELVGLNIDHINFKNNSFSVTRKGGNRVILYFGEYTADALSDYIEERKARFNYISSDPLFISSQDRRINVRTVENLVKKYAQSASIIKNISPHKLRSTYATKLYNDTGDIYLVAEVLGHKDVNTTKRHYAAISEEKRKYAAQIYKIGDTQHEKT